MGVGSNIEPQYNVKKAKHLISKDHLLIKESSFTLTNPIGPIANQSPFLNGAYLVETSLDLNYLTAYLKEIENKLGRDRTGSRFGPRTIDLDIVVWNGEVQDKDFYTRDFLKKTILEIIPDLSY